MIPYGRQEIDKSDIDAVVRVLQSDFLTQGPQVPAFEAEVAKLTGATYGIAMNSATSALHAACVALGVDKDDLVWTSSISFVASANCAIYCGAEVDFLDVDPTTGNISIPDLEERLHKAQAADRLPKVVIPVHFAGQPLDMKAIFELSQLYGFAVLEDASHALGAQFDGDTVGGCRYSQITVFSFHPVKMITTAEGGMATTNSAELAAKMQRFRSHGISRDLIGNRTEIDGDWTYDMIDLGFNYRMADLFAALGRSQLLRLHDFIEKREQIARAYTTQLPEGIATPLNTLPGSKSSWHLFVVLFPDWRRRKASYDLLRQEGYSVNVHYRPIYRQSFYARSQKYSPSSFPGAEKYYNRALSLPLFASLSFEHVERVVSILETKPGYQTIF